MENNILIELTADIVSSHVSNNSVAISEMPRLVQGVHKALSELRAPKPQAEPKKSPIVSVRSSVRPETLTCLACGKKQKALKNHLMKAHGLTTDQYRSDYELPDSYPMVARNYSEARRDLALAIGLGRNKKKGPASEPAPAARTPRKRTPRKK